MRHGVVLSAEAWMRTAPTHILAAAVWISGPTSAQVEAAQAAAQGRYRDSAAPAVL